MASIGVWLTFFQLYVVFDVVGIKNLPTHYTLNVTEEFEF